MSLLDEALRASESVISVIGAHAGESVDAIFGRKIADCDVAGRTFWVAKSAKARPGHVHTLCTFGPGHGIFVEPASPSGARPTTEAESAVEYSPNRVDWFSRPRGIGPVTGQIDDSAAALASGELTTAVDGTIDLWGYADSADASRPLKFILGLSTVCAIRRDTSTHPDRMKSRHRRIVAAGHLMEPFCVWLR